MRKKIILLGSILAIGTPTIITIACSQKKNYDNVNFIKTPKNDIKNIYLNKYYRPFQFNELKELGKEQPIMASGIGYASYAYGMSFLFNILTKIGFDDFENFQKYEPKIEKDQVLRIKYYNNNKQSDIKENNPEEIWKFINKAKVKFKHKDGIFCSGYLSIDPMGIDNTPNGFTLFEAGQNWGKFIDNDNGKWTYPNKNTEKKNLLTPKKLEWGVSSYWQMINGNKPKPKIENVLKGSKIIMGLHVDNYDPLNSHWFTKKLEYKTINANKKWSFIYHLQSKDNYLQGFRYLRNQNKIDEIKTLMIAIIKNINYFLLHNNDNGLNEIVKHTHPTIQRMFQYLKNLNFNDKTLLLQEKINKAIEELNNGSHDMFAVEIFARGIENIPVRYMPSGFGALIPNKTGIGTLLGMANAIDLSNLLKWMSTTKNGYADENGDVSTVNGESMDPNTMKPPKSVAISNQKRLGKEIKTMGGIVEKLKYKKWWKDYENWKQKSSSNKNLKEPILTFYPKEYLI